MRTPQEVWKDFDPRAEPLEIETIRKWMEDGCNYHEFYFTGETYRGQRARIYAIYSAPAGGKKLPEKDQLKWLQEFRHADEIDVDENGVRAWWD